MGNLTKAFSYSIGKKLIMGLTGLFLVTFLIEHLIGNMLILWGPVAYNSYAEFMGHNVFIRVAEVVLFAGFIFHIVDGLLLARENRKARPVGYAVQGGKHNSTFWSRMMPVTGIVLLVFLVLHLTSFWVKARLGLDVTFPAPDSSAWANPELLAYPESIGLHPGTDFSLWHKVIALFKVPWYSILYIVSMAFVGFHMVHGFQSAFQTLGVNHSKYTPKIKVAGYAFSVIVPLGFAIIPLYVLLNF